MAERTRRHPRHRLDPLLTSGVRLSIVAALDASQRVEFAVVRDGLEVSDSVLSKHVAALERDGYVQVEKGKVGRRPRTWLVMTPAGAEAFRSHLRAVRDVAAHALTPAPPDGVRSPAPGEAVPAEPGSR
jgi:DNA-binding MarR family transcriptional regulator